MTKETRLGFTETCKTCRYYAEVDPDTDGDGEGVCHRHAPKPVTVMSQPRDKELSENLYPNVVRPWVTGDDFCGEHSVFDDRATFVQITAGTEYEPVR